MRKKFCLCCLFIMLSLFQTIKCETTETSVLIPINKNEYDTTGRPKAPSRINQYIECWYGNGVLTIEFLVSEGDCTLTVLDNDSGHGVIYNFDSTNIAEVHIGKINNGDITILTSNDNIYYGEISL